MRWQRRDRVEEVAGKVGGRVGEGDSGSRAEGGDGTLPGES